MTRSSLVPVVLALVCSFGGAHADETEAQPEPEKQEFKIEEIAVIPLEHIGSRTAAHMVRSMLQMHRVAEVRNRIIVIHDKPEVVQAARALFEQIDVPLQEWIAELVTIGENDGESVVRRVTVGRSKVSMAFGNPSGARLNLSVDPDQLSDGRLGASYGIKVSLRREQSETFSFSESGHASWNDKRDLVILDLETPELQRRLADLLGQEAPVDQVRLRFRPAVDDEAIAVASMTR